ncbi:hypothetical protein PVJ1_00062 [Psychrobacillus phage PVJ1]|nr:hypothetical protein PVJ1_00062 [Psychrobacillus phage PVJ1]
MFPQMERRRAHHVFKSEGDLMSLIDLIKRVSLQAFNASNPVNVLFGTVSQEKPLEIEIHQKLKLTREFLVLTERVTRYEVDLEHDHTNSAGITTKALTNLLKKTPIRTGLKKGDKVVLVRVQGGQKFVVWDKVVDG